MTTHPMDTAGSDVRVDHRALTDAALESLLGDLGPLVQRDSESASAQLGAVIAEAKTRGLDEVEANAAYLCARAEVNQGNLQDALALINRARELWMNTGSELQAWRTDLGRMHVLDDLGRHKDAIGVGESLVATLSETQLAGEDAEHARWMQAAALENLGVSHGYLGDHDQALEAYAAAEQVYRDLDMLEEVPRPLGNRGVELVELGRYAEALETLDAAAEGFAANDDALFVAKCMAYEARAHLMLGNYLGAAAATQRASEYLDGQTATTEYARTQLVRAETLTWLNLLDEAIELYGVIIPQFAEAGLVHDLADAKHGHAVVLGHMQHHEDAWTAFLEAADLFESVGAEAMVAVAKLGQSELAEPELAHRLASAALDSLDGSGRSIEVAAAHIRMAQLVETQDEATRHLDAAGAILDGLPMPQLEWRALHERGRIAVRNGDIEQARVQFVEALAIIEAARSGVSQEHHRLPFMARRGAVLDDLLALELGENNVAAAYSMTERSRARTLVENMTGQLTVANVQASSAELDSIYNDLLRAPSVTAADLRGRARTIERRFLDDADTSRRSGLTIDRPSEFGTASVVTYQTIGNEVLAFLHIGNELSVVRSLATVDAIHDLLAQLDAQWRRFEDPGLAARQHRHLLAVTLDILQQLHLLLIAPIPSLLDCESLLVVPCEPLGNVPFAALHDGVCHLIERFPITMAPSVTVAGHARNRQRTSHRTRLAVGVVDPATPNVETEVAAVAEEATTATVLLNEAATVEALRDQLSEYDVIHLACHGVHRPDSPLFSALRLGDRWLTAAEVAGFDLGGQVVVLSACSSGRQAGAGSGDELVGLPRAFLSAGAAAVVVNLWQADDHSAQALMKRFHRELNTYGIAEALRNAQVGLMQEFPHPYHWAPPVVFGAPQQKESA